MNKVKRGTQLCVLFGGLMSEGKVCSTNYIAHALGLSAARKLKCTRREIEKYDREWNEVELYSTNQPTKIKRNSSLFWRKTVGFLNLSEFR